MIRGTARLVALALGAAACAPSHRLSDAQVEGAAVHELFVTREHARQLVIWTDAQENGPTFDLLGERVAGARDANVNLAALGTAAGTPARPARAADLARLFQAHPDGWAAFYVAYPGAPGLVEIARPAWSGDTLATVVIGRACGEHCFNAWRVAVRNGRVVATPPLRLPKS